MNLLLNIFVLAEAVSTESEGLPWPVKALIIALVVGLIVAFIYVMSLKSQLTSVYKNDTAADYTREKSFKVELSRDTFLYSKTDRIEKPQPVESNKK